MSCSSPSRWSRDSGLGLKPGSTLNVTFGQRNFPNYDELVKAWGGEEYVALQDGETFTPVRFQNLHSGRRDEAAGR